MVDLSDVARLAGVAKSTASRALNGTGSIAESTRSRVAAAAEVLMYVPSPSAVALATGRVRAVGVMAPAVDRWYVAQLIEGIRGALREHGLTMTLISPDAAPADLARRVDGVITIGLDAHETPAAEQREVEGGVGLWTEATAPGEESLHAARATAHLIAAGHTRIAFLGGDAGGWPLDRHRREGYRATMCDAGLEPRFVSCAATLDGGFTAAADLLGGGGAPTALIGITDDVAVGAIMAARRLGVVVPADVSIVGMDNQPIGEHFGLTTVTSAPVLRGAIAVRDLLSRMSVHAPGSEGGSDAPRLVLRESTGPVAAAPPPTAPTQSLPS